MNATVGRLLAETAPALPEQRTDAQILLAHVLRATRAWLAAHEDHEVSAVDAATFRGLARARRDGEPIAYLLGRREFHSLDFKVTRDVLIPRPETETLVDAALEVMRPMRAPRVLDLGTGTGCVAISIAQERPDAVVTASDVSARALEIARTNAATHASRVEFVEGEWLAPLAGRTFDLIVSNPPYIASGDAHLGLGDVRFEPQAALVSGTDGLNAIRAIVAGAPSHLDAGGWLLFEHGYDQAGASRDLLIEAGFGNLRSARDLAGIERVAAGRLLTGNSASR